MTTLLLLVLAPIALLDSTSMVPLCVVPLAAILGGKRPFLGATGFLAGIFIVYFACGLLLVLGLDALFHVVGAELIHRWTHPDTLDLILQVALGSVMVAFAWWLAYSRQTHGERGASGTMTPGQSFVLGVVLTFVGLPGAFPYFGSTDHILRADLNVATMGLSLLFYNLIFLLPLVILVLVRVFFVERSEQVFQRLALFSELWGRRLIVTVIFLVGIALLSDGIGWFLGYPILPVG